MFPTLKQRVIITLAVVSAGLLYLWAGRAAAADGGGGCSLLFAGSIPRAIGAFALISIPVILLAAIAAATGKALAGPFVVAAALAFAAVQGGPIDDWLHRIATPGAYWSLVGEAAAWGALVVVATFLTQALRAPLRGLLPGRLLEESADEASVPLSAAIAGAWGDWRKDFSDPGVVSHSLYAMLATAVVGGLTVTLLMRSEATGQVVWVLVIGFTLGGLLAGQTFPAAHPLLVLLSPLLVGMVGYGAAAVTQSSADELLLQVHTMTDRPVPQMLHLALALPIHYASAGVAGAAMGVGWAKATHAGRDRGDG